MSKSYDYLNLFRFCDDGLAGMLGAGLNRDKQKNPRLFRDSYLSIYIVV